MPEPEAPTEVVDETAETDQETVDEADIDWKAEAQKLKAESRKWETRAKDNSTAAARLAEIEEASKTAEQKLAERAENAEKELAPTTLRAMRAEAALEKGLTPTQAKRLVGTTYEEFLADADQLVADLGKQTTTPRPDHSQGVKGKPGDQSPADAFADIIRSQRGA